MVSLLVMGGSRKIKGRMDGFGGRAILQENGKVLAVVLSERRGRCLAYKLLYPTPRFPTQKSRRFRIIRDQPLYEHMTIQKTSWFSNISRNRIIQIDQPNKPLQQPCLFSSSSIDNDTSGVAILYGRTRYGLMRGQSVPASTFSHVITILLLDPSMVHVQPSTSIAP